MSKVTEKISATAEVAKQATIEATSKAKEGAYKAAAVSDNVDSGTRFEAAKGALEAHSSAQTASVKKDIALEKSGLPVAAEKISATGQAVVGKTTQMASAAVKPVVNTSSAIAGVVEHGTLQAKHEAQEAFYRSRATAESNTAHDRKEAAKSALEHHAEAKRERFMKECSKEEAGINTATEKLSDAATKVQPYLSAAADKAVTGATVVAGTISAGAATVGHATMEKTHTALENVNKSRAIDTNTTVHDRHLAAKAALEHHAAAKEHAIAKEEGKQASGIATVQQKTSEVVGTVSNAARTSIDTVRDASAAVGHAALEKKHAVQAEYFKAEATSEYVTPHDRVEAAKAALEHHAEMKDHSFQKSVAAENSGLNSAGQVMGSYLQTAGEMLATGARATVSAVQNIPSAVNALLAGGSAAVHKGAETTNNLQAEYYRNQAIDERVTGTERMEAAKAALEHEASARSHAIIKEQKKEESGINSATEKASELLQTGKEKLIGATQAVAPNTTASNMS